MSLYVCEDCGVIENTGLGAYWTRSMDHWPASHRHKALCSACSSPVHSDGSLSGYGQWHNKFPRKIATAADSDRVNNPEVIARRVANQNEPQENSR